MGCDIHSYVEVKQDDVWHRINDEIFPHDELERKYFKEGFSEEPLRWRNYRLFGFLANVRNYSDIPPLAAPRGYPPDGTRDPEDDNDRHSASYFTLAELLAFDYDQPVEDRRITVQTGPRSWDGGRTAEPGGGEMTTYREFLPKQFFQALDVMARLGEPEDVRLVFNFDN